MHLVDVNMICLVINKFVEMEPVGKEPPSNEMNREEKQQNLLMKTIKLETITQLNLLARIHYHIAQVPSIMK